MIPDPLEKKTKIPVRIVNGRLEYFYGGPLPKIKDGTVGDLVVPSFSVEDKSALNRLHREIEVQLLPEGTTILVAVNRHRIPKHLLDKVRTVRTKPVVNSLFVNVELTIPLRMQLRGSKSAVLLPTQCRIPALELDANSINHAYGIISAAFEPDRQSHGGNVFHKAFFPQDGYWFELDTLRNEREREFEHLLTED